MRIDGAAFGKHVALTSGGKSGRAANKYDAEIQRLQEERAEYVDKLQTVWMDASDPEEAEMQANLYKMAITGIDSRIAQLQKAKSEEAQRKAADQQMKLEPSSDSDENSKTGEAAKLAEAEKSEPEQKVDGKPGSDDPLALQKDEELFWIEGGDKSRPGKKRTPKFPSSQVDMSI